MYLATLADEESASLVCRDDLSADYFRESDYLLPYRIGHARLHKVGPEDINPTTRMETAAGTQQQPAGSGADVRMEPSACEPGPNSVASQTVSLPKQEQLKNK